MRLTIVIAVTVAVVSLLFYGRWFVAADDMAQPWAAPEFTHEQERDWINSPPLKLAQLRGKVVLIDFWTFDCWNCYRSFPWLTELENKFEHKDLFVLGVHTPEFKHEKDRSRVAAKMKEFSLRHAVMIDNDFSYWKAMGNRFWPTFYLLDKNGKVRSIYVGETHSGDHQAATIESNITALLDENTRS